MEHGPYFAHEKTEAQRSFVAHFAVLSKEKSNGKLTGEFMADGRASRPVSSLHRTENKEN